MRYDLWLEHLQYHARLNRISWWNIIKFTLFILIFSWSWIHHPLGFLIIPGVAMNYVAVVANRGRMPVWGIHSWVESKKHKPACKCCTRVSWLTDWIQLPLGTFSIGDFFIVIPLILHSLWLLSKFLSC